MVNDTNFKGFNASAASFTPVPNDTQDFNTEGQNLLNFDQNFIQSSPSMDFSQINPQTTFTHLQSSLPQHLDQNTLLSQNNQTPTQLNATQSNGTKNTYPLANPKIQRFHLAASTTPHTQEQVQARIELFTSKTCVLFDSILRSEVEQNGGSITFKTILDHGYLICDESFIEKAVQNSELLEFDSKKSFRPKERTLTIFIREVENTIAEVKHIFEGETITPKKVFYSDKEQKFTESASFESKKSKSHLNTEEEKTENGEKTENAEKAENADKAESPVSNDSRKSFYVIFDKSDFESTKDIMTMTNFINKKLNDGKICASVRHASKHRSAAYALFVATKAIETRLNLKCIDEYEGVSDILEHVRTGIKLEQQRKLSKDKEEKKEKLGETVEKAENLVNSHVETSTFNEPETKAAADASMDDGVSLDMLNQVAAGMGMSIEEALSLLASTGTLPNITLPDVHAVTDVTLSPDVAASLNSPDMSQIMTISTQSSLLTTSTTTVPTINMIDNDSNSLINTIHGATAAALNANFNLAEQQQINPDVYQEVQVNMTGFSPIVPFQYPVTLPTGQSDTSTTQSNKKPKTPYSKKSSSSSPSSNKVLSVNQPAFVPRPNTKASLLGNPHIQNTQNLYTDQSGAALDMYYDPSFNYMLPSSVRPQVPNMPNSIHNGVSVNPPNISNSALIMPNSVQMLNGLSPNLGNFNNLNNQINQLNNQLAHNQILNNPQTSTDTPYDLNPLNNVASNHYFEQQNVQFQPFYPQTFDPQPVQTVFSPSNGFYNKNQQVHNSVHSNNHRQSNRLTISSPKSKHNSQSGRSQSAISQSGLSQTGKSVNSQTFPSGLIKQNDKTYTTLKHSLSRQVSNKSGISQNSVEPVKNVKIEAVPEANGDVAEISVTVANVKEFKPQFKPQENNHHNTYQNTHNNNHQNNFQTQKFQNNYQNQYKKPYQPAGDNSRSYYTFNHSNRNRSNSNKSAQETATVQPVMPNLSSDDFPSVIGKTTQVQKSVIDFSKISKNHVVGVDGDRVEKNVKKVKVSESEFVTGTNEMEKHENVQKFMDKSVEKSFEKSVEKSVKKSVKVADEPEEKAPVLDVSSGIETKRSRSLQISDATSGNSSMLLTRDSGVDTDGDNKLQIVEPEKKSVEPKSITHKLAVSDKPKQQSTPIKKVKTDMVKQPKMKKSESLAALEVQKALESQKTKVTEVKKEEEEKKVEEVVDEWAVVEQKKGKKKGKQQATPQRKGGEEKWVVKGAYGSGKKGKKQVAEIFQENEVQANSVTEELELPAPKENELSSRSLMSPDIEKVQNTTRPSSRASSVNSQGSRRKSIAGESFHVRPKLATSISPIGGNSWASQKSSLASSFVGKPTTPLK